MSELNTTGWTKEDWLIQRYKYVPSEPAAIAAAALFGLTTLMHLFQLIKFKTWYFTPFFIGGLCMCQSTFYTESLLSRIRKT